LKLCNCAKSCAELQGTAGRASISAPNEQRAFSLRHCEDRRALWGAGPKQSPNTISYVIFATIASGDCFVAPHTNALLLLAMTGMKTRLPHQILQW